MKITSRIIPVFALVVAALYLGAPQESQAQLLFSKSSTSDEIVPKSSSSESEADSEQQTVTEPAWWELISRADSLEDSSKDFLESVDESPQEIEASPADNESDSAVESENSYESSNQGSVEFIVETHREIRSSTGYVLGTFTEVEYSGTDQSEAEATHQLWQYYLWQGDLYIGYAYNQTVTAVSYYGTSYVTTRSGNEFVTHVTIRTIEPKTYPLTNLPTLSSSSFYTTSF